MSRLIRLSSLFLAVVLSACATSVGVSTRGIDASDEELLATLASLARRGTEAICNPVVLEKELGIKIGPLVVRKHELGDGGLIERQTSEDLTSVSRGVTLKGGFLRFRSASATFCSFGVQLSTPHFCDPASERTQAIMGVPVQYGPDSPHGPQRGGIEYDFGRTESGRKLVVLGDVAQRCANGFVLISDGEWK